MIVPFVSPNHAIQPFDDLAQLICNAFRQDNNDVSDYFEDNYIGRFCHSAPRRGHFFLWNFGIDNYFYFYVFSWKITCILFEEIICGGRLRKYNFTFLILIYRYFSWKISKITELEKLIQ